MHLADGTLSNQLCTLTAAASAVGIALAAVRARRHATPRRLLHAAMGAAVVFAAQMVDVPFFGSVPVHMVGAVFLTVLSGPALALLAMTAVVVVQALVLNDGGTATLGANVFNMGVVAVTIAGASLSFMRTRMHGRAGALAGVAVASACSMLAAAAAMAAELAFSGESSSIFAATFAAHTPFAVWEALMTTAVVAVLARWVPAASGLQRVAR